ncbi:uncharacterized protein OCT59_002835 [Rhizophagus irregularis]|uniref:uncharacterized protein n=1 Tax=Rhizophagus irregularis TaxID=588596 RepID=UPI00332581C8|nr:hypothetical protein OCT59_002835 [Rhizophagus irregularis]
MMSKLINPFNRTIQIINYLYRGIGATEMKSKDKDQDKGERKWRNWLLQLTIKTARRSIRMNEKFIVSESTNNTLSIRLCYKCKTGVGYIFRECVLSRYEVICYISSILETSFYKAKISDQKTIQVFDYHSNINNGYLNSKYFKFGRIHCNTVCCQDVLYKFESHCILKCNLRHLN